MGADHTFSFPPFRKGRGSVKASASEPGVERPKPFGAGLGWHEAQRRGLGTAIVFTTQNRLKHGAPATKAFALVGHHSLRYVGNVKTLTVEEAQGQLAELIAEAHQGMVIVLTDGQKQVWLDTQKPLDLETDNSELEAELLKSIDGPFTPYSPDEMRSIGKRIIQGKRNK
jgi:hypothetical protein